MNEGIKAFLAQLNENAELQQKFNEATTPEEAYELAQNVQDGFDKDEFVAAFQEIAEALDDDLSDEELASAAGGAGDFQIPPTALSQRPPIVLPNSMGRPPHIAVSMKEANRDADDNQSRWE